MFDRANLYRIAPFGAYVFFMLLEDMLLKFGWEANDLRLLYAVKITVVAGLLWAMRSAYSELRWPVGTSFRTWAVAIVAGIVVFVAWINLTADWMVMGESVGFDPRDQDEIDWFLVVVRLVGAALVVPVMEELFWRSFLMRWIDHPNFLSVNPAHIGLKAFCITAVLFAVAHSLWLAGLFAGIVYNLLYMRSGTLWSPILAHAITNAILGIWIVSTGSWGFW
ncbi:MAG: CAAX prenyl protease-related protein [Nitrosomonas sp.]|uniref:CAAX prenyl protease-related protein n=1 Tax=Nitrosomonas sp. TaxID=42353 RepID=UPI0027196476|nr:CAAX prenyl protease-related protein [Nitrosomonas sp.]MDO8895881.1 CAAX prenyl protease-related protein [Nitrosomonas sp.]MDP1787682.1 CAAX prenyl protease-related protein [Nitrosomonas sp.]MDP3282389.1 CAAX prenyl protease-related protein [Nitrosomonas sp.]MDP3664161.1 CAAX prenyl protease-related protein [Nitrosomonas sp.]MDZ4106071.1 CAAX prenyl protease-related protein [Nitrosomonas sp.]